MPELPDVTVYVERIAERVVGECLERVRLESPFVLRTARPPLSDAFGRRVSAVRRLGKRIVIELERELSVVIHLMIAGRFRWEVPGARLRRGSGLAAFDFPRGSLQLVESSKHKRASIHVAAGVEALRLLDSGGLEVLDCSSRVFAERMTRERHTLKRALTDPRILSGIGNAYSDEILHAARLSPLRLTDTLAPEEWSRLYRAAVDVLTDWTERLRAESTGKFPEKVTAFREEMAVHGRYGQPCPDCGTKVCRIVHAGSETNYCPSCQTGGRLLADRALSRLLRQDWPQSLEELEQRLAPGQADLDRRRGYKPEGSWTASNPASRPRHRRAR